MYKKPSDFISQCIIQWYADSVITGNGQRNQQHFESSNRGSQSIKQSALEVNKDDIFNQKDGFDDERLNSLSINSYNISQRLYTVKKVAAGTTDVFLYGHSTFRDYAVPKGSTDSVRGVSVGGRYVSAAKMAKLLDNACALVKEEKLRIWLLSCHTSLDDLPETYAGHLARKLTALGWRKKQLIGFDKAVNTLTLRNARELASNTALYKNLEFSRLNQWRPHLVNID
ncbi:hypothetical protein [Aeromonas jandaei]|uniref:hypothetical protein n=1 Tax=Aeromonas jandaei TaxID=650 RepID=UPI003D1FB2EE